MRRRRISYFLVIALAASIGLLAGTKLQRESCEPTDRSAGRDADIETLIRHGCSTPQQARISLAYYDVGYDAEAFQLRKLCVMLSNGLERLPAALRALDAETRMQLVGHLIRYRASDDVWTADLVYDFVPAVEVPNLDRVARYNLARGDLPRARAQLTALVTAYDRYMAQYRNYDSDVRLREEYIVSKLLLDGLDARAQAAGGSKR